MDYYPFGMQITERTGSSDDYRYGFNGEEKDDELKGGGNSYDYGFRMYDPRIGRFLSVDPLAAKFPSWSPYAFAFDNPILNLDMDGLEGITNTHRLYFTTAGFNLFKKVTSDEVGFSPLGAAFALGQSAWESGYGNDNATQGLPDKIKKNNYWGMKFKGKVVTYSSFDKGFSNWRDMMTSKFSGAYDLLKSDSFTIDALEKQLNYGTYSYDPLTKGKYVNDMMKNAKNVLNRMVKVIDEEMSKLRTEADKLIKTKNENNNPTFKNDEDRNNYNNLINQVNEFAGLKYEVNQSIKAVTDALQQEAKDKKN